ncbi:cytochrome P450 [Lentzea sp. NPDC058436]|uniref:cytochrome P450 n=1 Tax=Lentzea sp. NPDC058436 TaxID=3346499 RepID=UPI0036608398
MSGCPQHDEQHDESGATAEKPIPEVPGLPVLGCVPRMLRGMEEFFLDSYRTHGPVFRVPVPGRRMLVLAGAEAATFLGSRRAREVLRQIDLVREVADEFEASESLVGMDGDRHLELRAALMHEYSDRITEGHLGTLVERLDEFLDHDWPAGADVHVMRAVQDLVVDQLGTLMTTPVPRKAANDLRYFWSQIIAVVFANLRPPLWLKLPRYRRARDRARRLGRDYLRSVLAGRRHDRRLPPLISRLLDLHEQQPDLVPRENLNLLALIPYFAGMDTVANALASAVYAITKHPDVHARVVAEADELFDGRPVDVAALRAMTATNGAIMETMRLWPVVVGLPRRTTQEFVFESYRIPADTDVFFAIAIPHLMEEYFPNPRAFDVDRYSPPRLEHRAKGAYSPYGRGTHRCIGQSLGEVLMALMAARIFHTRTVTLPSPDYVLPRTLRPAPGPSKRFSVRVGERTR